MKLTSRFTPLLLACLALLPITIVSADPVLTSNDEGNTVNYTSSGSAQTSSTTLTGEWASFTAPDNLTATGINLDLGGGSTQTATSFTYGIELGNSSGNGPDGTFLESGTYTGVTTATTGFVNLDLPDLTLSAGTVYYVVIDPLSSGVLNIHDDTGYSPSGITPYGYNDPNFARGGVNTSTNVSTAPSTTTSISYVVTTTAGYNLGNPLSAITTNPAGGALNVAQHFIFQPPATGSAISTASVTLSVTNATGTLGPVNVLLVDASGNTVAQATIAASSLIVGSNSYTVNFGNVALTPGAGYNLLVNSPTSTSGNVKWLVDETDTGTTTSAADELATYEGTDGYAFSYSSTSYATATQTDLLNEDYVFSYTTTAVPEPDPITLTFLGLGGLAATMFFRRNRSV